MLLQPTVTCAVFVTLLKRTVFFILIFEEETSLDNSIDTLVWLPLTRISHCWHQEGRLAGLRKKISLQASTTEQRNSVPLAGFQGLGKKN